LSSALHDLDDLAGLWAEEPTPEHETELRAIAGRVSLKGLVLQYADLGIGILITAMVLLALITRPAPVTVAVGLVAAAGLVWSSWKRHLLKTQIDLLLLTGDRSDLLDREIARVEAHLHRALVALWAAPPAVLLFAVLAYSIENGGSLAGFTDNMIRSATLFPVGPAILAAILTLLFQQVRLVQGLRQELIALQILRGEYREETRLDRVALG
jgi:hypothetical protein